MAIIIGEIGVAALDVGIDAIFFRPPAQNARAQAGNVEQRLQPFLADMPRDLVDVVTDARHHLPTITARAAITQMARFQDDAVGEAFLGKFKRGVDA